MAQSINRRNFLRATVSTTGAVSILTPSALGELVTQAVSPNDRIRIATVGLGQQGTSNTRNALSLPGVELVAVADLYEGRRVRAKELYPHIETTNDYRELVGRDDIDAVIVATSDHWHSRISIDFMEAGKDVYCEKPMVQRVEEGHQMIAAERRTKRILQVGSQRTSSPLYEKARDLLRSGAIGDLLFIEAWYRRSSANGAWEYKIPPDASPETVDWNRFVGHAPQRPFDALRFFRWRNFWDYGTGIPGDLFVHLLTGIHFITDSTGPRRVVADGGIRLWRDDREVPDLMIGMYEYASTAAHPAFNVILKVNFADAEEESGLRFIGSEGVLQAGRELTLTRRYRNRDITPSVITFPEAMQKELLAEQARTMGRPDLDSTQTFKMPEGFGGQNSHLATFISAVRNRNPVVQDSTFGLRAAGPALMANISHLESRFVSWDPEMMQEQKN